MLISMHEDSKGDTKVPFLMSKLSHQCTYVVIITLLSIMSRPRRGIMVIKLGRLSGPLYFPSFYNHWGMVKDVPVFYC